MGVIRINEETERELNEIFGKSLSADVKIKTLIRHFPEEKMNSFIDLKYDMMSKEDKENELRVKNKGVSKKKGK
jgi:hypothetical protein